jgi:hypothetical protein
MGTPDYHFRPPGTGLAIETNRPGVLFVGGLLEKLDRDARERERWNSTDEEAVKRVRFDARYLRAVASRLEQRGEDTIREAEYERLRREVHDHCRLEDDIETYNGFARELAKGLAEMNSMIAQRRAMLRAAKDTDQKSLANIITVQLAKDESLRDRFGEEIEKVRTTLRKLQEKGK